jgi:hypothetical protein
MFYMTVYQYMKSRIYANVHVHRSTCNNTYIYAYIHIYIYVCIYTINVYSI